MTTVNSHAIFEFWKWLASKRSIIDFFLGKQLSNIWGYLANGIESAVEGMTISEDPSASAEPSVFVVEGALSFICNSGAPQKCLQQEPPRKHFVNSCLL
jgi:hypothetical protein